MPGSSVREYSSATMARKIATLRSFYRWTDRCNLIESNPMLLIRTPRQSKRLPKAIDVNQVEQLLSASMRDRALLPPERTIDVLFHEFMADDFAMVERIYEVAGLPMTEGARSEIEAHLAGHGRGRHGRVVYDLREDFGVEPKEVREPFGEYLSRFPVRVEVD